MQFRQKEFKRNGKRYLRKSLVGEKKQFQNKLFVRKSKIIQQTRIAKNIRKF